MRSLPPEPRFDRARCPPTSREPRLVQTARMLRDPLGYPSGLRADHGPVFTLRLLPYRAGIVCATDPATVREVLTDQERFAAGDAAALLGPIVGEHSLILTPPPQHLRNRRLLLPAFHGDSIARWEDRVRTLAEASVPALANAGPAAARPWAQRLTLDVILRVVFGLDRRERVDAFRRALDALMAPAMLALLFAPAVTRRDLGRRSPGGVLAGRRAAVDALLHEEIAARRAEDGTDGRDDVLSVLLGARDEQDRGFTDAELRDELMGLVVAGHETTATALAWTLHLLAHHPDVRDELRDEIRAGSGELLKATIKESMRLRPPVFDAIRIARADTELGGRPVPAGAYVSALFSTMHLDPDLWPDPTRFRPQRHLEGKPAPYALTPFGGGVRRCLGAALANLELEVVLREVLRRAVPEPAGPPEAPRLQSVTIVPARGGRVTLRTG